MVYDYNQKNIMSTRWQRIAVTFGLRPRHSSSGFLNLVCEAIGTAATPGLLCQPRVIMKMIVEKQMHSASRWLPTAAARVQT
jgi:hypothetical protein